MLFIHNIVGLRGRGVVISLELPYNQFASGLKLAQFAVILPLFFMRSDVFNIFLFSYAFISKGFYCLLLRFAFGLSDSIPNAMNLPDCLSSTVLPNIFKYCVLNISRVTTKNKHDNFCKIAYYFQHYSYFT